MTEKISMRFIAAIFLSILSVNIQANPALQDNVLTWGEPHFPPYVITNGEFKDKGIDDLVKHDVIKRLTGYSHRFMLGNYARILRKIKNRDHVILTPLFKTQARERYVTYADIASYLVLPNGVIINKSEKHKFLPYLTESGALDIEKLVKSAKFKIGINIGRSYSGILDWVIKRYRSTGVFLEKTSVDLSESMFKMLQHHRIDAILGFPVEARYFAKKVGVNYDTFEVLPVDRMLPYSAVYFAAPKTEWGNAVIEDINKILFSEGSIARYVNYYREYLNESDMQRYDTVLKMYYSTRYPEVYKTLIRSP